MSVTPILVARDGGTIPYSYQLPNNQAFQLSSITAQWNGASASAGFWPCVSVYASDGTLIGRYLPQSSITAGDSGEVTYGPF